MSTLKIDAASGGSVSLVGSDTALNYSITVPATNGLLPLSTSTTGALNLPSGTTAQRPTPYQGATRYNSTTLLPEFYIGTLWVTF